MASSPKFFRMILQRNLEDAKLMIPKKFVNDHGSSLSSSILLKLPDGMQWKVGLTTAANGGIWLQKGWFEFSEHYCLEFGSLLVFRLDENSTFETTIFDPTGVETEYCCNFKGEFEEDSDSGSDSDSDFDASLEGLHRRSKKKEKPSVRRRQSCKKMRNEDLFSIKTEPEEELGCNIFRDHKPISSKKRMPNDVEVGGSRKRQKLANKAEATHGFSSRSEKPGFKVVMRQSNVRGRFNMVLPNEFAEKYLSEEFGSIRLQTANGRTWPLLYKWCRCRDHFAYISSGWKRFVEENFLKEGDVAFFEMIKKDKFLFTKLQEKTPLSPSPSPKKRAAATRNPSFEVVILFSSVLNIPIAFANEHFSPEMHSAELQVGITQWSVTVKQYESHVRFSAGWSRFYHDNGLNDGDTCLFEMVNQRNCVFKVNIFKKVSMKLSRPRRTN